MKKSPLSTPGGSNQRRFTPNRWNSYENSNTRGYPNNSYSTNNTMQIYDDNFMPLNISTPMTQYKKRSNNWYSPRDESNNASTSSEGSNYRNNYYPVPRFHYPNCYSPYKHSGRHFHGQRKGDKGAHRRVNISDYINISSFLEDPWANLNKKLNDSKSTSESEIFQTKSLLYSESIDDSSIEQSESKLSGDTDLDNSQSQQSTLESPMDTSLGEDNTDISQISKNNTSIDLKLDSISFSQDSLNRSTCSIDNSVSETIAEKNNICADEVVIDTDEKHK